jgi:CDP-paratose 2-epimerase
MNIALVTGSGGLIGAATVREFSSKGLKVVGIDNDMRSYFFGDKASTKWQSDRLAEEIPGYVHRAADIRNRQAMQQIFQEYGSDIKVIIHAAAQPSHDWAAKEPETDFSVNANGTLVLLEMTRLYCPEAVFIFTSTNKVYGDTPNRLPLVELETRWELAKEHPYHEKGIDESMSIDNSTHSLFGVSKVAADLLVQEYGRYFGLKTGIFRGGCLTGPGHSGAELHGFLAYLVKCVITGTPYTVFGYEGKQVRDNIHCADLTSCFYHFYLKPRRGEVYNMGGSRFSNCSMKEAILLSEEIAGKKLQFSYSTTNRIGDHIWWISDVSKFQAHYPNWRLKYDIVAILKEIHAELEERLRQPVAAAANL